MLISNCFSLGMTGCALCRSPVIVFKWPFDRLSFDFTICPFSTRSWKLQSIILTIFSLFLFLEWHSGFIDIGTIMFGRKMPDEITKKARYVPVPDASGRHPRQPGGQGDSQQRFWHWGECPRLEHIVQFFIILHVNFCPQSLLEYSKSAMAKKNKIVSLLEQKMEQ
jgi:hypothetical protein